MHVCLFLTYNKGVFVCQIKGAYFEKVGITSTDLHCHWSSLVVGLNACQSSGCEFKNPQSI